MEMLRKLHHSGVTVPHTFRIRERIDFYERICRGHEEMLFEDYPAVRARMNELMDRLDTLERPCCLSHIDSVADNFLFLPDGSLRLIDWEYAGMCDPLIDIAMCSIYSYYSQEELDHLLEEYPARPIRRRTLCHVCLCGARRFRGRSGRSSRVWKDANLAITAIRCTGMRKIIIENCFRGLC